MDQQVPRLCFLRKESFACRQFTPQYSLSPWPPAHHARRRHLPASSRCAGSMEEGPCSQLASALALFTKHRHRCPADALPPRPGLPRLTGGQGQGGGLPGDTRAQTEDLNLVGTTCTRREQPLHGGRHHSPPSAPNQTEMRTDKLRQVHTMGVRCTDKCNPHDHPARQPGHYPPHRREN